MEYSHICPVRRPGHSESLCISWCHCFPACQTSALRISLLHGHIPVLRGLIEMFPLWILPCLFVCLFYLFSTFNALAFTYRNTRKQSLFFNNEYTQRGSVGALLTIVSNNQKRRQEINSFVLNTYKVPKYCNTSHTHTQRCTHIHIYTYDTQTHIKTHTSMHTYTQAFTHTRMTHMHRWTHTNMHTYTYPHDTYMHKHTWTHTGRHT